MVTMNEINEPKKQKKEKHKLNKAKVLASFFLGLVWLTLLVFTLVTDPIIMMFKHYTQVTNGSMVHEIMMKEMEGIHLSTYMFNITNAEEFMSGKDTKLKVQEVGPFTYKELRSNTEIDINLEEQTVGYTPKIRMEFVPEESIGNPHDIKVTVPNLPMLGMTSKLSDFPYFTRYGFNLLATQLNSKPIVNLDAYDYLWGYKEPIISLAHTFIPGSVKFDKMGIMDRIHDPSKRNRIVVSIADKDKFMIRRLNGYTKLQMGESGPDTCLICDTFENVYEGVGYPAQITPNFPLRIYRNGLCRILDMEFHDTKVTDYGAEALVYHFSDSFFTLDSNETSNGVLTLPDCFLGMPLAFSKAHFLDSDPSLYERIEGLQPDDKYRGWVTIDPRLGITLETVYFLQLNLVVSDVSISTQAKSFSNMVIPICFLEIRQPPLPQESLTFLNGVYVTGPYILIGVQLLFLILTILSWTYCARAIYLNSRKVNTAMSFPLGTKKEINTNTEVPLMTKQKNYS